MPRTARADRAGIVYHVVTRGNARALVFHDDADYAHFLSLLADAEGRREAGVLGWCLMPNHVHLVARSDRDGGLGRFMQWVLTSHVIKHRLRHATVGRIWQGRFKAVVVQDDAHLLTVLRYVERNPVRAGLVRSARDWPWSSVVTRLASQERRHAVPPARTPRLVPSPVEIPESWLDWVDRPQTRAEEDAIRASLRTGWPFGEAAWAGATAAVLEVTPTRATLGRPGKPDGARLTRNVRLGKGNRTKTRNVP